MTVPICNKGSKCVRVLIKMNEIKKIVAYLGLDPLMFVHAAPSTGIRLRKQLEMVATDMYYDPTGKARSMQLVCVDPQSWSPMCADKTRDFFKGKLEEVTEEMARDIFNTTFQ